MSDWINQSTYYAFSAKGIQNYILRSDRLKEMVGASELIEGLSGRLLPGVLAHLGYRAGADYEYLTQAAGGVRMLFREDAAANEVARMFPLLCDQYAPGLQVVQVVAPMGSDLMTTIDSGERLMSQRRNLGYPELPPASSLSKRCPRSGLAAVGAESSRKGEEPVDGETRRKNEAGRQAAQALIARVAPEDRRNVGKWVFNFDDMAGEGAYLAVIHADANSLGAVVQKLRETLARESDFAKARDLYRRFSSAVQDATESSARAAFRVVEAEIKSSEFYPLRPIVCAGDDLTVVIKAEHALAYVREFLVQFEKESQARLAELQIGITDGLTACAGVAFVKKHYPYWRAYELSESLCKYSKRMVDRKASALAFWRVTTSLGTDYEDGVVHRELTTASGSEVLTMNPYRVGSRAVKGTPHIDDLLRLHEAMRAGGVPSGSLRQIMTSVYQSRDQADRDFERVLTVAEGKQAKRLIECLAALGCEGRTLWTSSPFRTPLLDAIELQAVRTCVSEEKEP
jgi:hypothetical protein